MPRRFALGLLVLLLLLLGALLVGQRIRSGPSPGRTPARPTMRPTPVVPPTPIPARLVALYFENGEDEKFHPEARDLPSSADSVLFLRSVASAVLDGPKREELVRPFPDGWTLRAAFQMKDGVAILDLAPPPPPADAPPLPPGALRWETGSREEESAAQALLLSVTKNIPEITRIVLLVAGEPVETLAGHLDLTHPLRPDPSRAVDEPPLPPPTFTPTPDPSASPAPAGEGEDGKPTSDPTPPRPPVPSPAKASSPAPTKAASPPPAVPRPAVSPAPVPTKKPTPPASRPTETA